MPTGKVQISLLSNMAVYTILDKQKVSSVLADYSTDKVKSVDILSGGSENSNYLVITDSNKYVLTICEQKTQQEAQNLADLLEHLAANGFATSKLIRTKGNNCVAIYQDNPVLLKKYIAGRIMEDLPSHLIQNLGQQLGKLHQISAPTFLPQDINYGIQHFADVSYYAPDSTFYKWLTNIGNIIMTEMPDDLPRALIHADVFYNNVIVSTDGTKTIIMDFEEACNYIRVFDLGMMIIGLCSEGTVLDLKKVKYVLTGYMQEITLLPKELQNLKLFAAYAAAATAFWRHKHFNFVEPEANMKDHYLIMKQLADHIMQLGESSFYFD